MAKSILITGASSGIGRAVAFRFAERGYNLGLVSRRDEVLEEIRREILSKHPDIRVEVRQLDVTNYSRVREVVHELHRELDLDIVFANAGIGQGGLVGKGNFDKHRQVIETNLLGNMATVDAAVEILKEKGKGHIAVTSSIAAVKGMPYNASYNASKAAIDIYVESARAELLKSGITFTLLSPGYIDTPLNDMLKFRPFLISLEKGSRIIARLIEKRVRRSPVPLFPWIFLRGLLKMLPVSVMAKMK